MDKSPDAFRTISEVADSLDTPAHVLRFWESRFPQIKPVKRAGGRRYYRPYDVALLSGIKRLLHDEGLTIRGVQKILRDHGVRHVAGLTDDSVSIDELTAAPIADAVDPGMDDAEVPEAGFIAVEDAEADPAPPPPRSRAPVEQSVLPLFDTPPALSRADPPAAPAPARKPTLRTDTTFASMIRALPRGSLRGHQRNLADLVQRLAALRARLAERAEGGDR
ncbi:MAG: MerR family transcriptional regulator [Rhodobacterales bacterium]|nr:MerR family transcriptional regulator [Rhodobacterales bacterium]